MLELCDIFVCLRAADLSLRCSYSTLSSKHSLDLSKNSHFSLSQKATWSNFLLGAFTKVQNKSPRKFGDAFANSILMLGSKALRPYWTIQAVSLQCSSEEKTFALFEHLLMGIVFGTNWFDYPLGQSINILIFAYFCNIFCISLYCRSTWW